MKVRKLKKKYPFKLDRLWIKHLVEWKQLSTEYHSIRLYYIESCKKHLNII